MESNGVIMKNIITKIINHLEQELSCYQEISKVYDEQKEALVKNRHEELEGIDSKIITLYNRVKLLNEKRTELFNQLKPGIEKLSEVIEIAKEEESPNVEKLENYKETFKKLSSEIEKKQYINFELLKTGINISDKKLGLIIEAFIPQGSIYNGKGENKDLKELSMSTINEEV